MSGDDGLRAFRKEADAMRKPDVPNAAEALALFDFEEPA